MKEFIRLTKDNLLYIWLKIKLLLSEKVDKVEGKGLSTNDLTDELKEKILKAGDSSFSGNFNDLINKPTKLSDFTNDSGFIDNTALNDYATKTFVTEKGYQTAQDVNTLITNAIKDIQGISYSIVEALPETGEAGVIYLISNNGANPNSYDEYIWVNNKFEKIGTTEVDLTGYIKETDLVEITNDEVDALFDSIFNGQ